VTLNAPTIAEAAAKNAVSNTGAANTNGGWFVKAACRPRCTPGAKNTKTPAKHRRKDCDLRH
jgi:hypothetical protein